MEGSTGALAGLAPHSWVVPPRTTATDSPPHWTGGDAEACWGHRGESDSSRVRQLVSCRQNNAITCLGSQQTGRLSQLRLTLPPKGGRKLWGPTPLLADIDPCLPNSSNSSHGRLPNAPLPQLAGGPLNSARWAAQLWAERAAGALVTPSPLTPPSCETWKD